MILGVCNDGRELAYSGSEYVFRLAGTPIDYESILALDRRGKIRWRALELRDWFTRIDPAALENSASRARIAAGNREGATAHEKVLADAARDDSILAGTLVDASPALVQAVVDELDARGILHAQTPVASTSSADGSEHGFNPLAVMDLPDGMQPLSQMERARGVDRPMTRREARLMKAILRNDDKQKAKRERARSSGADNRSSASAGDAQVDSPEEE